MSADAYKDAAPRYGLRRDVADVWRRVTLNGPRGSRGAGGCAAERCAGRTRVVSVTQRRGVFQGCRARASAVCENRETSLFVCKQDFSVKAADSGRFEASVGLGRVQGLTQRSHASFSNSYFARFGQPLHQPFIKKQAYPLGMSAACVAGHDDAASTDAHRYAMHDAHRAMCACKRRALRPPLDAAALHRAPARDAPSGTRRAMRWRRDTSRREKRPFLTSASKFDVNPMVDLRQVVFTLGDVRLLFCADVKIPPSHST